MAEELIYLPEAPAGRLGLQFVGGARFQIGTFAPGFRAFRRRREDSGDARYIVSMEGVSYEYRDDGFRNRGACWYYFRSGEVAFCVERPHRWEPCPLEETFWLDQQFHPALVMPAGL